MPSLCKVIFGMMFVLALITSCVSAEPTPTPVPPINTPVPPTSTPANTPVPPTSTPIPPTAEPSPTVTPTPEPPPTAALMPDPGVTSDTWFKTYGGNQNDVGNVVLLADDGGFFIVGATNLEFEPEQQGDIYLIRTNAAGEILWEKTYGEEGYEAGRTVFQTSDGGLMISGVTNSLGAGGMDVYLIKVDQDGNELWSKTFGGPLDEMAGAWPMDDGGYILGGNIVDPNDVVVDNPGVAGYAGLAGRSNIYLARTDSDGNEIWSRTFGGENNVLASGGIQTPDGGFVILATILYFPDNDDDIYLLKVDENGDEVWSRTWERGMSSGYDLVQTPDGNYLVTGPYSPPDDMDRSIRDFLFVKFDPEGNEIWMSTFGDPDVIDYGSVLAETTDGGYVAAGWMVRDLITWDEDIVMVKIDESGQLLWEQIIETDAHSMFGTMLQHPDGGYVIAGSISNGRNFDIFMIKTDSQGNVTAASEPAAAAPALAVSFEQSAQTFPSVPTFQIGLGDLDGDGDLDAVFANAGSNYSQVWLNDGSGHFTATGQQLTQQGHGIDVGDLDGDGDLDVFITRHNNTQPSKVYLNDGDAVFQESDQEFSRNAGYRVYLADIDGDGDLDAMGEDSTRGTSVYLNDGEGHFTLSEMTLPETSIWGDLDSDGDVDVFFKEDGVGYQSMLNDGTGSFTEYWAYKDTTAMIHGDIALGDIDSDGDLDAIVTNGDWRSTGYPALVFLNDDSGRFTDRGQRLSAVRNASVSLGDLNGDGYLDLVFTDFEEPNQIWINDGAGQFIDSGFRFGADQFYRHAHLGDLDQDGDLDIFLATFGIGRGPNEVWFNITASAATAAPPTVTPLPPLTGSGDGVIAFTSERDGNAEIYIMNADGSDPQRLTNDPAYDAWPTWSPDGSQIAFASTRNGKADIYVMNADGSNLRQLTQHSAGDIWPEWSPDGTRIAFPSRRDGNFEIYVINVDGTNLQRLTNTPDAEDFPAWSPDSSQIVFSSIEGNEGTYIMNADGGDRRQLTDIVALEPAWSPDGTRIAFGSDHEGFRGIYVMDADGSNLQKLSSTRAGENCPDWSPDGTRIAFASWRGDDGEIYVMDADGSNLQKLTDNGFEEEFPAWRPVATVVSPAEATTATPMPNPGAISPATVDQIENLHTISGHSDHVWGLAFSPDGALLASGSVDGTVKLWDMESRQLVRTLGGHGAVAHGVAFSLGGVLLASINSDMAIKLWDVESGQELRTLSGHRRGSHFPTKPQRHKDYWRALCL